jgi:hypothetical protein
MELVLNGLQWQICLIYLDDIIVFGSNFSEHIQRIETRTSDTFVGIGQESILATLSGFGLIPFCETTWPKKATSDFNRWHFSGFNLRPASEFSLLVKPLTELTKKSNKFLWSDSCQQAFDKLKQAFVNVQKNLNQKLLCHPNRSDKSAIVIH